MQQYGAPAIALTPVESFLTFFKEAGV